MRPQAKRPESTMKFWAFRNNRALVWKETSHDIPLRNHLRLVLLVALVHLAPSKRAAEVSKVSQGAAYRSQSKKICAAVSFEKPHAHEGEETKFFKYKS